METITIQELYESVRNTFQSVSNLKALYVGKTKEDDADDRKHEKDYNGKQIIATGTPEIICKAEDYFIKNLKRDFSSFVDNKNNGSGGNPDATHLYMAWIIDYKDIDQLDEPDILDKVYVLKEK